MSDRPPRRENALPLEQLDDLVRCVAGEATPTRLQEWLGVNKRTSERWLSGDSTFPPKLVEEMQTLAPVCSSFLADLEQLVADYVGAGMSENLVRLRLRDYSRTLSEDPPPKPENHGS